MDVTHNCFPLEYQEHINYFLRSNLNPYNNCLDVKFKNVGEQGKVVCYIKSKSLNFKGVEIPRKEKHIEKIRVEQKKIFSGLIDSLHGQFNFISLLRDDLLNSKIHALFQIAMEKILSMIFLFRMDEQESRKALAKSLEVHLFYNFKDPELKLTSLSLPIHQNQSTKANNRSTVSIEEPKKQETFLNRSRFSSDEKNKGRKLFESPRKHDKLSEPAENTTKSRRKTSTSENESNEKALEDLDDTALEMCRLMWNIRSKNPQHVHDELEKSVTIRDYKKIALESYVRLENVFLNHPNMNYLIQLQCSRMLKSFPSLASLAGDINRHIQCLAVESLGKTILEPISKLVLESFPKGPLPEELNRNLMLSTIRVKIERCEILLKFFLKQLIEMESCVSKISYSKFNGEGLTEKIIEIWQHIVLIEMQNPSNETCTSILESFLHFLLKPEEQKTESLKLQVGDEIPGLSFNMKLTMLFLTLSQEVYSLPTKAVLESMPAELTQIKKNGHSIRLHFFEGGKIKVLAEGTLTSTEKSEPAKFEITVHNILNGYIDQAKRSSYVSIEIRNTCLLKKPIPPFVYNYLNQVGFKYNLNPVQKKEV